MYPSYTDDIFPNKKLIFKKMHYGTLIFFPLKILNTAE